MNYKDKKWHDVSTSYLKTFNQQVPVFTPSVYREFRGEIFTTYHTAAHPVNDFLEENMQVHVRFSKSFPNVLRGLHYDDKTYKLVQALVGEIYLVVLDAREDSPTCGQWESYILSEKTRDQVLIPPGFANGHYCLTESIFHYTLFYFGDYIDETKQKTIKWNDPKFKMSWPTNNPILQGRDQ
jgi:dTDP-4-dehydrorhamnose 3,5-epimerase